MKTPEVHPYGVCRDMRQNIFASPTYFVSQLGVGCIFIQNKLKLIRFVKCSSALWVVISYPFEEQPFIAQPEIVNVRL